MKIRYYYLLRYYLFYIIYVWIHKCCFRMIWKIIYKYIYTRIFYIYIELGSGYYEFFKTMHPLTNGSISPLEKVFGELRLFFSLYTYIHIYIYFSVYNQSSDTSTSLKKKRKKTYSKSVKNCLRSPIGSFDFTDELSKLSLRNFYGRFAL